MSEADLTGKVAIVTGGNSGIGKEAAIGIARDGAHVVIAARNREKAAAAIKEIVHRADAPGRVETIPIDLASFASVRAFVDEFNAKHDRLDVLLNNAGLVLRKRIETVDGHEGQFQINHLGHFLLTNLLYGPLVRSAPARIVNVSSYAHTQVRGGLDFDDLEWEHRRYKGFGCYSATKLMNVLFTRELARRNDPDVLTANVLHPGFVASSFGRDGDLGFLGAVAMPLLRPFAISQDKGALTSIYLSTSPDLDGITGQYFVKGKAVKPSAAALDDEAAVRLWEISEKLTAAQGGDLTVSGNDRSPLAGTEVHYLRSEHVGDEFKIFVGHCGDTDADGEPPAVLYVSDANGLFAAGAVEMVRFMQLSAHLPPILVVGIGYRMGGIDETVVVRTRDFTPTYDEKFVRVFPQQTLMGGAGNFLAFIRDELKPWVQSHYRVAMDGSMFFGHSQGGLFATYVLLTEPQTFGRYGIGSPSLWWDNDTMFDCEAQYAATHDDLPANVFFSVGAFEDHDGRQREVSRLSADEHAAGLRYIDMVADAERMVAALRSRNYPSLAVESVVLPDEFHVTVAHLNLSRALRNLFDAPR